MCGGGGVLCWIGMVFQRVCVCCLPSVHLDAPSICCVCVCVCRKFKSFSAGRQVFALLMLFLCVILYTMWSGKSLNLLCILPFCIL